MMLRGREIHFSERLYEVHMVQKSAGKESEVKHGAKGWGELQTGYQRHWLNQTLVKLNTGSKRLGKGATGTTTMLHVDHCMKKSLN